MRALPAAAVAVLAALQGWHGRGSIASADWLGYAVVTTLLLAVAAAGARRPPRRVALAALALVGLAAWDGLSLRWSAAPSLAHDEALLTLLYAVALLVPALSLVGHVDRLLVSGAVVAVLGGMAVAAAVEVVRAASLADVYYSRRLDFPISYPNGEAAFALIAVWPGLALAAQRALPAVLRAAALAAACAGAGCWALAESKGGALGLAISTVVAFTVSRQRLRLLVPFGLAAALTGLAFVRLTAPYRTPDVATLHRAGETALLLALAGFVVGLVYALGDGRVTVGERASRRLGWAALAVLVAVVVGGTSVFAVRVHDPRDSFAAQWRNFKHLPSRDTATSHFVSLGSNRYDFWRVAVHQFRLHPLAGIGARGFRDAYLQERRSGETPARSHSLELDVLSETGIVGFLALLAAVVLIVAALGRRARDDLVALGALGAFACWLAHASVDWTWSFPAIGVPVFVLAGAAATGSGARLAPRIAGPIAVAAAALAIGAFGLPWLAAHYVRTALSNGSTADLRRAHSLDPISLEPLLAQWALAPRPRAGIAPLATALRMEPRSPDLLYALGRQQLAAGDKAAARRTLRRALALDPQDPAILDLLHRAR